MRCSRCGKQQRKPGTYCAACVKWFRRRHARWAKAKPGRLQGKPEQNRPDRIPMPVTCLTVDVRIATPGYGYRLGVGFAWMNG